MLFCSYDLDLDPMTLIYDLGLDILKMDLQIKPEVSRPKISKVQLLTFDSFGLGTPGLMVCKYIFKCLGQGHISRSSGQDQGHNSKKYVCVQCSRVACV